jgi:hypothetical protein
LYGFAILRLYIMQNYLEQYYINLKHKMNFQLTFLIELFVQELLYLLFDMEKVQRNINMQLLQISIKDE